MGTTTGPALKEPGSETVAASGSVAVSGSYSDPFAQSNPGELFLSISTGGNSTGGISTGGGTLSARDAAGNPVAGSGSGNLTLNIDYADLNAVLNSLTYTAGTNPGSSTIGFDIWDQAGVETTGSVPVTIVRSAATRTWTGAASTNWTTPQNWSGGAAPIAGDTAIIPGGTPHGATLSNATLTGETIILAIPPQTTPGPVVTFNTVTLGTGTRLEVANPTNALNSATLDVTGTFTVGAGAIVPDAGQTLLVNASGTGAAIVNNGTIDDVQIDFASGGTLTNHGLFETDGDHASVDGNIAVANSGTVLATNHGALEVANGDIISGGTVALANGSLQMGGTFENAHLALSGADSIVLFQRNAFGGDSVVSGFGKGDQIDLQGNAILVGAGLSFANNKLTLATNGTIAETIPLTPGYGLGNFEETLGTGVPGAIAYAPNGGATGIFQWDITAPDAATVTQGGTLALGGVSIGNATSTVLTVTAQSGTLSMNGATGSGTKSLSVSGATAQVNADLQSLKYIPAAGATTDTLLVTAGTIVPDAYPLTERWLPVTINAAPAGPALAEPKSETIATSATVAVGGSYSNGFAATNPGFLFLGISDSSGTLSATDASGHAAAGSGTHGIAGNYDYADLNAILASLHYTAGAQAGADAIGFDIWNQAGVETTGTTAITIGAATAVAIAGTIALAPLPH